VPNSVPKLLQFPPIDHVIACMETVERGYRDLEDGNMYFKDNLCRQINYIGDIITASDGEYDTTFYSAVQISLITTLALFQEATGEFDV